MLLHHAVQVAAQAGKAVGQAEAQRTAASHAAAAGSVPDCAQAHRAAHRTVAGGLCMTRISGPVWCPLVCRKGSSLG